MILTVMVDTRSYSLLILKVCDYNSYSGYIGGPVDKPFTNYRHSVDLVCILGTGKMKMCLRVVFTSVCVHILTNIVVINIIHFTLVGFTDTCHLLKFLTRCPSLLYDMVLLSLFFV